MTPLTIGLVLLVFVYPVTLWPIAGFAGLALLLIGIYLEANK